MKKKTEKILMFLGIGCVLAVIPNILMVVFLGSASIYGSVDEKIYVDETTFSSKK
jgi:hypothetical protein